MRGTDGYNESLFSTVRLEDFVPASHLQLIEPRSNPSNITVGQKRLLLCRCAAALLRRIVSSHDFIGVAATR